MGYWLGQGVVAAWVCNVGRSGPRAQGASNGPHNDDSISWLVEMGFRTGNRDPARADDGGNNENGKDANITDYTSSFAR